MFVYKERAWFQNDFRKYEKYGFIVIEDEKLFYVGSSFQTITFMYLDDYPYAM